MTNGFRMATAILLGAWGAFRATLPILRPLNKLGSVPLFFDFAKTHPIMLATGITVRALIAGFLVWTLLRVSKSKPWAFYGLFFVFLALISIADILLWWLVEI